MTTDYKVTELFCITDEFCKHFDAENAGNLLEDNSEVKREESHYQPIPIINDFKDTDGNDCMKQAIQDNYNQIKEDVKQIVKDELERIAGDENLKHLKPFR